LGWQVTAFTRNQGKAAEAEKLGARTILGELQSADWWGKLSSQYDHAVNCVGAAAPSIEGYRVSYLEGMHSIGGWLKETNQSLQNLIFTSSSSVYPQTDGSLVDEKSTNLGVSARGQILLDAEQVCLQVSQTNSRRKSVVRFSGLYGPGRHLLVDKIRQGEPMTGSPDRVLNLIHRDDAASAVLAILQSSSSLEGGIFNASDGQHATRGEIADWVASRVGVPKPAFINADVDRSPHRRVDSSKIGRVFGWVPRFADFQSGYEDFLASEES
jgi:nucleoside-diphosphate-sugar epimerase